MHVTFFGTRGSIATSGQEFSRMGGNTTCLEVEAAGERIILDAGTGLRALGNKMMGEFKQGRPLRATLLFTHYHWDHIQGFPFFTPAFVPAANLSILGPVEDGNITAERALTDQMTAPNFPVPLSIMGSRKEFGTIQSGQEFNVGAVKVRARALAHPQGSFGYRIEAAGKSMCFATDTEHPVDGSVDPALLDLAQDVDLLVMDAQYTLDEYEGRVGPSKKGWGHSTVDAAVAAAKACGARSLALFHHDPGHVDAVIESMEQAARHSFTNTFAAREGLTVACG